MVTASTECQIFALLHSRDRLEQQVLNLPSHTNGPLKQPLSGCALSGHPRKWAVPPACNVLRSLGFMTFMDKLPETLSRLPHVERL